MLIVALNIIVHRLKLLVVGDDDMLSAGRPSIQVLPQLRVLHLAEAGIFAKLPIGVVGHPFLSLVGVHHFSEMAKRKRGGEVIMKSTVATRY